LGHSAFDALNFEAIENIIKKEALHVAARFLEKMLNMDTSDHTGPAVTCIICGKEARYVNRNSKTFTTVLGDITLERAYYYCSSCAHGFCPKDYTLGFDDTSLSPGVTRMVSLVASAEPFLKGTKLLSALAAVNVSAKGVERTAKKIGAAIAADDVAYVVEKPNPSDTMYAGVDGTGIPMRKDELIDRVGKQSDGTSKTREVKQCVVWTADSRDAKGNPTKDPDSVSYSAAIESCAWSDTCKDTPPFAARVERELTRRGYFNAKQQVFIGDGAPWIWNLASMIVPNAIQIIDLYHAKEHLSQLAGAIFGFNSDLSRKWADDRCYELESGNLDAVLSAISCHSSRPGEVGKHAARELEYFNINQHRMKYDYFRSLGLCVGSGVVEAGCRVLIGQRLKQSGMFWGLNGANAIIALRSSLLSDRFDDFWERYRINNSRVPQKAIP
jgi:hypothetical protein